MQRKTLLFKHFIAASLIGLASLGCSDQPINLSQLGTPGNSGAPGNGGVPGNSGASGSGGAPGNSGTPITLTPPVSRTTLTVSGPMSTHHVKDAFEFQICAGKVCDKWEQNAEDQSYEYTFELAQWPLDQPVTITANRLSKATGAPVDAKGEIYFTTKLDTLTHLTKMDSENDGNIDENEFPPLSIDPVNMAFNTIAAYLLQDILKQYKDLPTTKRNEAVKRYLSKQSMTTWVDLTKEQRAEIAQHLNSIPAPNSWRAKFIGEYDLQLTKEQWKKLKGGENIPFEQQSITLNTGQLKILGTQSWSRKADNRLFRLTTKQMAKIRGNAVFSQQLVLELAALYQLLTPKPDYKINLSSSLLTEHLSISNPGDGEPEIFDMPYEMSLNQFESQKIEMFDAVSPSSGKGITTTWTFEPTIVETIVKRQKAAQSQAGPQKIVDFYQEISSNKWPTFGNTLEHIGLITLTKLSNEPNVAIWKHYQQEFVSKNSSFIPTHAELNIDASTQKQYRYLYTVNELTNPNFHHPLKKSILSIAPEKQLRISGRFPKELETATLSVVLGSRPNKKPTEHQAETQPERHLPLPLIVVNEQRRSRIDYSGKNGFVVTIPLRNIDNKFEHCKPGVPEETTYEYTEDEMQDTLTIHVDDERTGVQLRSILGSFCELVRLDQNANNNGTLEISELQQLNVGYISTALSAAMMKTSISKSGYMGYMAPWTQQELNEKFEAFPREHTELLAAIMAMQAKGNVFGYGFDFIERAGSYADLVMLLGLDLLKDGYGKASNNTLPTLEQLQDNLAGTFTVGEILLQDLELNISHITHKGVELLGDSETDAYYFGKGNRPGTWVSIYPVSNIDPTCQALIKDSQVVGIRIAGKGENNTGKWVTIGWDAVENASSYTIAWSTQEFSNVVDAEHSLETNNTLATLSGLEPKTHYYIRVSSDHGVPSAHFLYSPIDTHISDTRATIGIQGDDSLHGRDSDSGCDVLSGKAINSNKDGMLGARYTKIDNNGNALKRQDLTFKQQPFACVLDAQTGIFWETKKNRGAQDPYTIRDSDNLFTLSNDNGASQIETFCALPGLNVPSTDHFICTVANQIKWTNEAKLCGLNNWRLPTLHEFYGITSFNSQRVDRRYFNIDNLQRIDGGAFHAFWLDSPSLDGQKNRTFFPGWLEAEYREHAQPNALMLVSDGFETDTQL